MEISPPWHQAPKHSESYQSSRETSLAITTSTMMRQTCGAPLSRRKVKRKRKRARPSAAVDRAGEGGGASAGVTAVTSDSSTSPGRGDWSIASAELVGMVHTYFTFRSLADAQVTLAASLSISVGRDVLEALQGK